MQPSAAAASIPVTPFFEESDPVDDDAVTVKASNARRVSLDETEAINDEETAAIASLRVYLEGENARNVGKIRLILGICGRIAHIERQRQPSPNDLEEARLLRAAVALHFDPRSDHGGQPDRSHWQIIEHVSALYENEVQWHDTVERELDRAGLLIPVEEVVEEHQDEEDAGSSDATSSMTHSHDTPTGPQPPEHQPPLRRTQGNGLGGLDDPPAEEQDDGRAEEEPRQQQQDDDTMSSSQNVGLRMSGSTTSS